MLQAYSDQYLDQYIDQYIDQYNAYLSPIAKSQIKNLQAKLDKHIFTIAALGLSCRGKTSVLNALQGKKKWLTSPPELDTDFQAYPDSDRLQIHLIDTPGLDGSNPEVVKKAIASADLVLMITAGDLTRLEVSLIKDLQAMAKPILLVCNKADLLSKGDRQAILAAWQTLNLPPANILFTSAAPLPRPVRIELGQIRQEIWEPQSIEIYELRQRLWQLLNQDGSTLIVQTVHSNLAQLHKQWTGDRLEQFLPPRSLASCLFILKALPVMLAPSLAIALSLGIDGIIIVGVAGKLGYRPRLQLIAASLIGALVLANLTNSYAQILWMGIVTTLFINWLWQDLQTI